MPAKNFQKDRFNIIDIKYHKQFVKETGIDIDYKTFKSVIVDSNASIANAIIKGNDGVRLPKGLGVIAVCKYKTKEKAIDWKNSNEVGKRMYHNNLDTFQNMFKIKWFRIDITTLYTNKIFKFDPCRSLQRGVSKFAKETNGNKYFEWQSVDFYDATRLERYMLRRNTKKTEL